MILIDTHTHLYSKAFDVDRDQMIERALKAGISRFYLPAIDSSYTESMYSLKRKYSKNVFLMTGLHPTHVRQDSKAELAHVKKNLESRKFVAIGEIGIDLYMDKTNLRQQKAAFRFQIKLAKQYKLPIVIHCRDAFDEVFDILEAEKADDLFGIFHCFTGTLEQAYRAISYNMKLGIGGVVTFKNGKIDQFLSEIDLLHIVLETDAPYLSPVPHRGKRNESAYLLNVLDKVAAIYGRNKNDIAQITTNNALDIFKT